MSAYERHKKIDEMVERIKEERVQNEIDNLKKAKGGIGFRNWKKKQKKGETAYQRKLKKMKEGEQ